MVPEKAQYYINQLQMLKHPEGGWYKETYRARGVISSEELPKHGGARNYSTGIYFLLTEENFSAFHRIKSDEMWHFYDGDGLTIHEIQQNGNYINHSLHHSFILPLCCRFCAFVRYQYKNTRE